MEVNLKVKLISFQPLRTIGIPGVTYIKPEHTFKEIETIKAADVLLFPEKWQLPILHHALKKNIFPSYDSIILGHNKVDMTRSLQALFPAYVPYTEIHGNTDEQASEILDTFSFPFVAKQSRNSMGNGVFLINDEMEFNTYREKTDILYIQEYLPSDREMRICIVGDEITASYWKVAEEGQFLHNIAQGGKISFEAVPKKCTDLVKEISHRLNINHAGFDILYINDHPYILEFNVLFGNQGIQTNRKKNEQYIIDYLVQKFSPQVLLTENFKTIS